MLRKEKNSKYKEYHIHPLKTNMAKDDDKVLNCVHVIMYVTLCKHIFKIITQVLLVSKQKEVKFLKDRKQAGDIKLKEKETV